MKRLEEIVGELAGCDPGAVDDGFSLDRPGLDSSLRRAILIAAIRRELGKDCMQAGVSRTFGELRQAVAEAPPARGKS
jgi:hypothetical protein